jgi:hypothetical protein
MNWYGNEKGGRISALFILVNAISGLLGNYAQAAQLSQTVYVWILAAVAAAQSARRSAVTVLIH